MANNLKELTWEHHQNAERTEFADLLLSGDIHPRLYQRYLHSQLIIYSTLEAAVDLPLQLQGVFRSSLILEDLQELEAEYRLKELKERREKAIDRMKQSVTNAMQLYGIEKVESSFLKLSFRKSESVEVINEAQLLPEFTTTKVTTTPNKTAIKEAIKRGEVVEGAVLVTNQNLQIR